MAVLVNGQWSLQQHPAPRSISPSRSVSPSTRWHKDRPQTATASVQESPEAVNLRVEAVGLHPTAPVAPTPPPSNGDILGSIGENDLLQGLFLQHQQYSRSIFEGSLLQSQQSGSELSGDFKFADMADVNGFEPSATLLEIVKVSGE